MKTRARKRRRRRPPRRSRAPDPTTKYARAVVRGDVVASKFVRQACARHLEDLKTAKARGLRFDRDLAWRAITFSRTLRHIKGRWAGQYIVLEPWEEFIVGSIFGWRRGRLRRFRDVYVEVARKNGKSSLIAVLMILLTFFDGEGGAEGYVAATKKDQARIIFNDARVMVRRAPAYRRRLKVLEHRISDPETASFLAPLGADADTLDGLNPHAVCLDELHAHPNARVLEVMESGSGARAQPICIKITTAGFDRNSVCWRQREHAVRVLDPASDVEDDALLAFICTLDEGDDWKDEKVWAKANPNLGVSVEVDELRRAVKKAIDTPEELPNLLQKRFCVWVTNSVRAIDMTLFDAGAQAFDVEKLRGRACYAALDLAPVHDLSSLALVFPPEGEGEPWKYLGKHWIPDEDIRERSLRDRVPYETWRARGQIIATPGDVTDFDFILAEVLELGQLYEILELAYDPMRAGQIAQDLQREGVKIVEHFQGYQAMTLPCSETLRLVRAKQLLHAADPVLRWAADNLVLRMGPAKRMMPDKDRSRERIDPMVALIMACGRAAVAAPPEANPYDERGVRRLGE